MTSRRVYSYGYNHSHGKVIHRIISIKHTWWPFLKGATDNDIVWTVCSSQSCQLIWKRDWSSFSPVQLLQCLSQCLTTTHPLSSDCFHLKVTNNIIIMLKCTSSSDTERDIDGIRANSLMYYILLARSVVTLLLLGFPCSLLKGPCRNCKPRTKPGELGKNKGQEKKRNLSFRSDVPRADVRIG